MTFTIPPGNKVVGSPSFITDIDNTYTALSVVAGINVQDTSYAGGADNTGSADSTAAIQAAISAASTGGTVYMPAGTYKCNVGGLLPVTGVRLTGAGSEKTIITCSGADLWNMAPGSLVDHFELDHLQLNVTGGHIFTGADLIRGSFHHLKLIQNSSNKSIWSAASVVLFIENVFSEWVEYVYGATRSVPAWDLTSSGVDLITENTWQNGTVFNQNSDSTQRYFSFINSNANASNRGLNFRKMVFEHCVGGALYFESASGVTIDDVAMWDSTAANLGNPFVEFKKNAGNSSAPSATKIRGYRRIGDVTFAAGTIPDIRLDSNCTNTQIESPAVNGSSVALTIDNGSASNTVISNYPSTASILNTLGNTQLIANGKYQGNAVALSQSASGGLIETVQNTSSAPTHPSHRVQGPTSTDRAYGGIATGDTSERWYREVSGLDHWGPGNAPPDTTGWSRNAAGQIKTTSSAEIDGALTLPNTSTAITSEVDVANTTTETDLVTLTLPTGILLAGTTFRIEVMGTCQCKATSGTLVFTPYLAGVAAAQTPTMASQTNAAGPSGFWLTMFLTVRSTGATGAYVASGRGEIEFSTRVNLSVSSLATATIDTTTATPIVKLTATWATADAANSLKVSLATIQQIV